MIVLPFPPPALSPNARKHWGVRARAFKAYKADCLLLLSQYRKQLLGRESFDLKFCPPDRHRRDLDNMLSSAKGLIDALSDTCGVDDSKFNLKIAKGEPVKGGCVVVA